MALTLSGGARRIVVFTKGLRTLNILSSKFSSQDNNNSKPVEIYFEDEDEPSSCTVWPDKNLGIFGPKDTRLPLPGNIGIASTIQHDKKFSLALQNINTAMQTSDLLTNVLPSQRHESVISQVLRSEEEALNQELEEELMTNIKKFPDAGDMLECVAQPCPKLVRKEFLDLFPDRDVSSGTFTIITLSQKTANDMTAWNNEVDEEREQLTEFFIAAAENICNILKDAGFWADFIDPTSGKPFLGGYTSAVLSETDERYRHFGFSIEDLGCCKVISHHLWGTRIFVGSLFTNVPVDDSILQDILLKYSTCKDEEAA